LQGNAAYDYAATVRKAQGTTVDRGYVLGSTHFDGRLRRTLSPSRQRHALLCARWLWWTLVNRHRRDETLW